MRAPSTRPVLPVGSDQLLDKAEHLIWSLLDDDLPEQDFVELETILRERPDVREVYIHCVQLHAELAAHFGKPQVAQTWDFDELVR